MPKPYTRKLYRFLAQAIELEREQDALIARAALLREQAVVCEVEARALDLRIDKLRDEAMGR
jgi:hypothetical protein